MTHLKKLVLALLLIGVVTISGCVSIEEHVSLFGWYYRVYDSGTGNATDGVLSHGSKHNNRNILWRHSSKYNV